MAVIRGVGINVVSHREGGQDDSKLPSAPLNLQTVAEKDYDRRSMIVDLRQVSFTDLLRLYSEILQELVRRKLCRSTNNPVADIAELLVTQALKLSPAAKSTKGYDAVDASGKRYEIKGRRITAHNQSRMLSAIRDCEARHFDYLAGVLFREDFSFSKACVVPFDLVHQRSTDLPPEN